MRGYLFWRDEKEYNGGRDFIENKQHAHSKGSRETLELGIKEFEEGRKEAEKTWKAVKIHAEKAHLRVGEKF